MTVTYPSPEVIQAAITIVRSEPVGIIIDLEGETITYKFKAYDENGKLTREGEYTESLAEVAAEDENFNSVYAAIKSHVNSHHTDAGMPAGGVVS